MNRKIPPSPPLEKGGKGGFGQKSEEILWTKEATERLDKVPSFLKGMVKKGVERYAREKQLKEITPEIMAELRKRAGR